MLLVRVFSELLQKPISDIKEGFFFSLETKSVSNVAQGRHSFPPAA